MKKFLIFCVIFFTAFSLFSQNENGKIAGKIIDTKGDAIPFVIVSSDPGQQHAQSGFEGEYELTLAPGKYSIKFQMTQFKTKIIQDVVVKKNETFDLPVVMEGWDSVLGPGVTVYGKPKDESVTKETIEIKNAGAQIDMMGADRIKNQPTKDVSDILRKMNGASVQDNRFVIIRGLNDRYNGAFLNGAPLPSSESDRKAFAFDIFPSNMLDNLSVAKTATPDMPGEFAGGLIFVKTKNIPEKNFQSFSIGGGYNTVATGKDRITYKGGKLDWLGIDDGTRSLPSSIPDRENFPTKVSEQAELAKNMPNDWALVNSKFAPNTSFQYAMGRTFKKKNKISGKEKDLFGMIVSASYNRANNMVQTTRKAYTSSTDLSVPSQVDNEYNDRSYSSQTLAGAIANFSCKLNENNTLTLKNIYSVNADDRVIYREGNTNPNDANPTLLKSTARWFTGNKIYSGQLNGEHSIPKAKLKVDWIGSFSGIRRDIPNLRRSIFTKFQNINDPSDPNPKDTMYVANISLANVGPSYGGGVFNAKTKEKIFNGRFDISRSFDSLSKNQKLEVKSGFFYQLRNRSFEARQLGFTKYSIVGGSITFNDSLLYLDEANIFNNQNMGLLPNGSGGFKLMDATKPNDQYTAQSKLAATYLMFDYRYKDFIRLITGVRYEAFNQQLNAKYDSGLPLVVNTQQNDWLPSANAIFSLTSKQNIRLAYSQTLNRPEFRELAPFAFYDFNTQFLYSGNENLKRAKIHNYDVRYEIFPGRGQLLSLTGFYKNFINPIEQISRADVTNEVSFANAPKATNAGGELELRFVLGALLKTDSCKFLNDLTVFTNFAYIQSKVTLNNNPEGGIKYRQLQGQSPYVFNAGLTYQDQDNGWSCTISANRVGQRIAIVGNVNEPDIWENGRTVIDLQLGKTCLKKKLELRLMLRDGLAQKLYFFQDRNDNKKLDKDIDDLMWVSKFGRVISFNATYRF